MSSPESGNFEQIDFNLNDPESPVNFENIDQHVAKFIAQCASNRRSLTTTDAISRGGFEGDATGNGLMLDDLDIPEDY